jgi:hypothetical protein
MEGEIAVTFLRDDFGDVVCCSPAAGFLSVKGERIISWRRVQEGCHGEFVFGESDYLRMHSCKLGIAIGKAKIQPSHPPR